MSVYSDVILVIEKELESKLWKKGNDNIFSLLKSATKRFVNDQSVRYEWDTIKWHEQSPIENCYFLHRLLETLDVEGENYYICKITPANMDDTYTPLDTWGSYCDKEFEPVLQVEFQQLNIVLQEPYNEEETFLLKDENDIIQGIIAIDLNEIIDMSRVQLKIMLAKRLTKVHISKIRYKAIELKGEKLLFQVEGQLLYER